MVFDTERKWASYGPIPIIQDSTTNGIITVQSTHKFRVNQHIELSATGEKTLLLKVKRVLTTQKIAVGEINTNINQRSDLSLYTVAKNTTVTILEQPKTRIPKDDRNQAAYEQEPLFAYRIVDVDEYGQIRTAANPYPINITSSGNTQEDRIKNSIVCAPDVVKALTWSEINGVRRIIKIEFTSAETDALFNGTYRLDRVFTYQTAYPFDLINIQDTLVSL